MKNADTAGILICLVFNFIAVTALSLYYLKGKQWNGQLSFDLNDNNN